MRLFSIFYLSFCLLFIIACDSDFKSENKNNYTFKFENEKKTAEAPASVSISENHYKKSETPNLSARGNQQSEYAYKEITKTPDNKNRNYNSHVNYYTNTDGISVPSPTYYRSAPANATAVCRDGTYSFSLNRKGTCSRHGGVENWLK